MLQDQMLSGESATDEYRKGDHGVGLLHHRLRDQNHERTYTSHNSQTRDRSLTP